MNNSPTVLEINSAAVRHNLHFFRSKLQPSTKLMAVVKAFAYGTDPVLVGRLLQEMKVDYLAVAYTHEGVVLRKAGISLPILVLNPQPDNFEYLLEYRLEPDLHHLELIDRFELLVKEKGLTNYPVHIMLNTGMNRLGFKAFEIDTLAQRLKTIQNIKVVSLFSHLAASEDPDEREFTLGQIAQFEKMTAQLIPVLREKPMKHIVNTSGILNYPEAHFDMVRLGIGLYGFANDKENTRKLLNVSNLKTTISHVQHLKKGETVSYNRHFKATKPSEIAVVPLGYADGVNRLLSDGKGHVWINGQKAPIAGTICMDIFMVDVTGMNCRPGDEVIIFNNQEHVAEIARTTQTITYEVLTSISQRVRRKLI